MANIGRFARCFADLFGTTESTPKLCIEWLSKCLVQKMWQIHFVLNKGEYMDGSTLSEMNKTSFEIMGIVNLTIKDDVYNYCGKTYN